MQGLKPSAAMAEGMAVMVLQVQSRPEAQPGPGGWHQQGLPRRAAALAEAGF